MISPPATRPGLGVLIAGVVAVIAFTPWLLMPNSESETGPIATTSSGATPTWAPAEPQGLGAGDGSRQHQLDHGNRRLPNCIQPVLPEQPDLV